MISIDKTHTAILIAIALLATLWTGFKGIAVNTGNYKWVKEDGSNADSNAKQNLRWSTDSAKECKSRCIENTLSCNAWTFSAVEGQHNCWGYKSVSFRSNVTNPGYESGEICKLFSLSPCFSTQPKIKP